MEQDLPGVSGQEGQTMAEYSVVLAVITIAAVVALTALSTAISSLVNQIVPLI
ncbi:MAG: Flp family type IVb pilin [Gaiellales bacterium]